MELFGTEFLQSTYLWTGLSFFALLLIIWKFAMPAIEAMLDERAQQIRSDLETAEKARQESEKTLVEYEKQLQNAKEEAKDIIAKAREEAQAMIDSKTTKLETELAKKAASAQTSIEQARESALRDIQKEVATLTIAVAEKLLKESIDEKKATKLADRAVKQLMN